MHVSGIVALTGEPAEHRRENPRLVPRQAVLVDAFVLRLVGTQERRLIDGVNDVLYRGFNELCDICGAKYADLVGKEYV